MAGNEEKHSERAIALEGVLDRLVFASDASEFIVGRMNVRGRRDPVTIVGLLPKPRPGETLLLHGQWEFDKKFGEQFRFETAEARVPSTVQGIEKYLSSDLIKGIGPEMAKRITAVFGEKTLDIIEKKPEKLRNVPGIGPVRAEKISEAFVEQKSIRDVMLFLQTHGVSTTYAYKIFKRYGNKSAHVVRENPYVLATDIRGIGFRSADRIAGSIGIDMRSPLRANAGILHVLDTAQSEGHVYYPLTTLLQKARELLGIDNHTLEKCVKNLAAEGTIVIESEDRVYLAAMAARENTVARNIRELMVAARFLPGIKIDVAIQWVQQQQGLTLSEAQCQALHAVIEYKVLIVTGGPGTGKTTLLKSLIEILERKRLRVLLCAPTGRAAKRLAEATGREARTVHRLLEYSPSEGGFQRGPSHPLEAEAVVVDETSMVDISLMYYLLGAIHPQTTLILVGDADQLPSVGPGNVLGDLIESGKIHVVRLQTVFRQASESMIVVNAHRINQGLLPTPTGESNALSDFYFIEKDDPDECVRLIKEMVSNRIPGRFGFDPVNDLQILSPMHKGSLGTENLNRELREVLNPYGTKIRGDRFRVGDRVMQTRNNYDKEVYNGDIGRIENYNAEEEEAVIEFDGRPVIYHISELDEITLAYAVTIHKSQGSEYPCVIIPMTTQHYVLLRRNLLYTALTRGRSLVVVIGSLKALQMAVENRIVEPRFTHLAAKI
jgi:exodeoxyribonuclease V alpha subunit